MILAERANNKHNFENSLLYHKGFKALKLKNLYNRQRIEGLETEEEEKQEHG